MNDFVDSFAYWLADYYLATTALLAAALVALQLVGQPVKRLAVAKAAIVSTLALAMLCAMPSWSVMSLSMREMPRVVQAATVSLPAKPIPTADHAVRPDREVLPVATPLPIAPEVEASISWSQVVVAIYLLGSSMVAVWLAVGAMAARGLVRRAELAPANLNELLAREAGPAGTSMRLLLSDEIDVAVALGIRQPQVILPRRWVLARSPEELTTVLAHEAAHVRNGDLAWLAWSRVLMVLLWAQPLVWLLRRALRLDQEVLADVAAADRSGRQQYAEQLVAWARELTARPRPLLPAALGLWEGPSQLRRRVAVLLDERLALVKNCSLFWRGAVFTLALVAALVLSLVSTTPGNGIKSPKSPEMVSAAIENSLATYPVITLPQGSLSIDGLCIDKAGAPLAGVDVALFYQDLSTQDVRFVSRTKSDSHGTFHFTDLPTATRALEFRSQFWIVAWAHSASALTNMMPWSPRKIEFKMPIASAVSGRVTDIDGKTVAGALVQFHPMMPPIQGMNCDLTDANGDFIVSDLSPLNAKDLVQDLGGGHRRVSNPRFRVVHSGFASADVRYDRVPTAVNVVLQRPATIHGQVVYDDGRPAGHVRVNLQDVPDRNQNLDDDPTSWAETTTDDRGHYELKSLRAGQYNVWAAARDFTCVALDSFEVRTGESREAPDLQLIKGGFLAGRLVDSVTGKRVTSDDGYISVGVYGPSRPRSGAAIDGGRIEADGSFRFRLPPGRQYVYVSGQGPWEVEGEEGRRRRSRSRHS